MTVFEEDVEFLQHFGVKGMKWGVRRAGSSISRTGDRHNRRVEQARREARAFQEPPPKPKHPARNLGIGIGVGIVGGLAVKNYLEKFGSFMIRELMGR